MNTFNFIIFAEDFLTHDEVSSELLHYAGDFDTIDYIDKADLLAKFVEFLEHNECCYSKDEYNTFEIAYTFNNSDVMIANLQNFIG